MSRFLLFTVLSLIFSCSSKPKIKFFDYDEIIHYSNNFDGSKLEDLFEIQSKSQKDSLKLNVIIGNVPKDITDLFFIEELEGMGYTPNNIDKSKFTEIDKIFVEKTADENISTSCISIYRDILLFKKQSKVIGTAKICFDCIDSQIKGTTANIDNFGQDGDYSRLRNVLLK